MITKENYNNITRPHRFSKPVRSFVLVICFMFSFYSNAQNTFKKELKAGAIKTISIQGNQIFNISVVTSKTESIKITSTLDGEYQNKYQITTKEYNGVLTLGLAFMDFESIPNDKRNAHKVIAAKLDIEIPENLDVDIKSDVGSVVIIGKFNNLFIELLQGFCNVNAIGNFVTINTIDGDIIVLTKRAKVIAYSNNGEVMIGKFSSQESNWDLRSVNGDITVAKQE